MFDLNRGMKIQKHPEGYNVGMYFDDPGRYFDEHGNLLSNEVAAEAGFDVIEYERTRRIRQRRAELEKEAEQQIDEELKALEKNLGVDAPIPDGETVPESTTGNAAAHEPLEILREVDGHPRETNYAYMVFKGQQRMWEVVHKKTGEKIGEGLEKAAAEAMLLATKR